MSKGRSGQPRSVQRREIRPQALEHDVRRDAGAGILEVNSVGVAHERLAAANRHRGAIALARREPVR